MRTITKAAALAVMLALPVAAFAAQATTAPAAKKAAPAAKKTAAVAKHTTSGTVKSVTDSSLVITKAGKDQTFVVNSSTEKTGTVAAGDKVSVHYTVDGKNWVATAITAAPAKTASKSKGKK
jgi:FKBP-type peptidyl-prolyl cis-trans isomerase